MLLFFVCLTGFSYAQEVSEQAGAYETVDETSLILFPEASEAGTQDDDQLEDQAAGTTRAPSSVGAGDLLRVLVVLALVIGVIYLLVYFLRRFSPLAENREEQIGLLATRHLKKDSSLHLVEVGNQVFLIGSGTNNVSLISEITDQETIDKIRLDASVETGSSGSSFRNIFRKSFSAPAGTDLKDKSPDFLRAQRDRLKNLRREE